MESGAAPRRAKLGLNSFVPTLAALAVLLIVAVLAVSVRWNATDSVPEGWWWLHGGDVERGSFVVMCLPAPLGAEALAHHYLAPGWSGCPSGAKPVLKVAVGLPGDRVAIDAAGSLSVFVGGGKKGVELSPCGRRFARGTDGAPIRAFVGYGSFTIGPRELWLCGLSPRSWDSRYFGPVPVAGLRGVATPVWTRGSGWGVYNTWQSLFANRE